VAGGLCDPERAVEVAGLLLRGAREVDGESIAGDRYRRPNRYVRFRDAVALELIDGRVGAVGQIADRRAHLSLGVAQQLAAALEQAVPPVAPGQFLHSRGSEPLPGKLGQEIADPLGGVAHVGEQDRGDWVVHAREAKRWQPQSLAEDAPRAGGKRAGGRSRRSLMLAETADRTMAPPICSARPRRRRASIRSSAGLTSAPARAAARSGQAGSLPSPWGRDRWRSGARRSTGPALA